MTFFVTQWTKSFLSKDTVVSQNGDICSTMGKNVFSQRVSTSSLAFESRLIVHYQHAPHAVLWVYQFGTLNFVNCDVPVSGKADM